MSSEIFLIDLFENRVHVVSQKRNDPSVIDSNERLLDRLRKIAEDIKECGNAIDTYHKETRLGGHPHATYTSKR